MAIPTKTTCCKECVSKSACFNELSENELIQIDTGRFEVTFKKGEIVCKQGMLASHLIYIKKGFVKLYIEGGNNKNIILTIEKDGYMIGLQSLFGNNVFHYTAVAYEDTTVCLFEMNVISEIIEQNSGFASKLIAKLNENTIRSYSRLFCLTQKQSSGRLADILLCLSDRLYKSNKFEMALSRKDLAEITVMSVESLSRVIKEFKDDGIIKLDGRKLEITDRERLERICENG
ncbi:Crp/Fnr family transcriptional regulator [Labilibaculum sp. DW002]|uniref:Crp/Fnr family transcriptional regulator n=1 Tax=Paralabilibaculum antarcticum TaxID=2912572 RepID=A0ABT5VLX6_9BACT|nr:Crp/Fnr family transcriptional regulator [Labilibaculum sp. DW002]MDE5416438.1 Crp/Fnr family transcriptional regulator [Labilibaculum sp. DW002]